MGRTPPHLARGQAGMTKLTLLGRADTGPGLPSDEALSSDTHYLYGDRPDRQWGPHQPRRRLRSGFRRKPHPPPVDCPRPAARDLGGCRVLRNQPAVSSLAVSQRLTASCGVGSWPHPAACPGHIFADNGDTVDPERMKYSPGPYTGDLALIRTARRRTACSEWSTSESCSVSSTSAPA